MSFRELVVGFGDDKAAAKSQAYAMLREQWPQLVPYVYEYSVYDPECVAAEWTVALRIANATYDEHRDDVRTQ